MVIRIRYVLIVRMCVCAYVVYAYVMCICRTMIMYAYSSSVRETLQASKPPRRKRAIMDECDWLARAVPLCRYVSAEFQPAQPTRSRRNRK